MEKQNLKPLSQVAKGRTVMLVRVDAGCGLNNRLAAMGLLPNVQFKVMDNQHPGPFVINLKGSRMALGHGMANKIIVSEV
jgi:Fe2+ transport system protein FeoA